jgi:hypothetical protein
VKSRPAGEGFWAFRGHHLSSSGLSAHHGTSYTSPKVLSTWKKLMPILAETAPPRPVRSFSDGSFHNQLGSKAREPFTQRRVLVWINEAKHDNSATAIQVLRLLYALVVAN